MKNKDHNQFNSLENSIRRWEGLLKALDHTCAYRFLDALFEESSRYKLEAFKTEPQVLRDFDFMYCAGGEL